MLLNSDPHLVIQSIALGLKEGGSEGQGCLQTCGVCHPQCCTVKVGQQPLVWVEAEGFHQVNTGKVVSHAGQHSSCSSIRSVNMCPAIMMLPINITVFVAITITKVTTKANNGAKDNNGDNTTRTKTRVINGDCSDEIAIIISIEPAKARSL